MYKISLFLLSFLTIFACSSPTKLQTENTESEDLVVKNGNTLLWKIEKEGMQTSYIYGTIHMINEEFYHFSSNLRERILGSDAIIMEVGGMPNPVATYQLMMLDSGTVHSYFSPEQLVALLEFMDLEMGVSPQEFDQSYAAMKPFVLMQTITQDYFEPTAKSYDLEIMGLAAEHEIPLIGLETIEEQLGFFDKIPKEKMALMIIESIQKHDEEKAETLKLMEFYAAQKVDKLIPLLQKQSPEFMEFEDLFLYDRNRAWIPTLESEMKNKSCFIAVGAGHLFGEKGVIALLQQKGYTITAISAD